MPLPQHFWPMCPPTWHPFLNELVYVPQRLVQMASAFESLPLPFHLGKGSFAHCNTLTAFCEYCIYNLHLHKSLYMCSSYTVRSAWKTIISLHPHTLLWVNCTIPHPRKI